jgi:ribosome-binding factor A
MAKRRFERKSPVNLCTDWAADDGLDPRLAPQQSQGKVGNRKTLQLCRQVEQALSLALEGELLRDLTVASVVPAPDSSRMLATVVYHGPVTVATTEVLTALDDGRARLRREVAAAICRRKTPELSFRVLRAG